MHITSSTATDSAIASPRTVLPFARLAESVLANDWVTAGLIFLVTRFVALAGAYAGITRLIEAEPARSKGWLAELALMWDAAWYTGIAPTWL